MRALVTGQAGAGRCHYVIEHGADAKLTAHVGKRRPGRLVDERQAWQHDRVEEPQRPVELAGESASSTSGPRTGPSASRVARMWRFRAATAATVSRPGASSGS